MSTITVILPVTLLGLFGLPAFDTLARDGHSGIVLESPYQDVSQSGGGGQNSTPTRLPIRQLIEV